MKRVCLVLLVLTFLFDCVCAEESDFHFRIREPLDLQDCNIMRVLARLWKYNHFLDEERAVWIVRSNGNYSAMDWPLTPQPRITIWSTRLPDHIIAQAHTHGDHLEPTPSDTDVSVAKKLNIWVYTLTRKGIWQVNPNGVTTQQANRGWFDTTMWRCSAH
jgi:hypothetical protein